MRVCVECLCTCGSTSFCTQTSLLISLTTPKQHIRYDAANNTNTRAPHTKQKSFDSGFGRNRQFCASRVKLRTRSPHAREAESTRAQHHQRDLRHKVSRVVACRVCDLFIPLTRFRVFFACVSVGGVGVDVTRVVYRQVCVCVYALDLSIYSAIVCA